MKSQSRKGIVNQALVLIAIVASGMGSSLVNAAKPVPIHATIAINETVGPGTLCPAPAPFPPGSILQGAITGNGQASHMGKVSLSSLDCIYPLAENVFRFVSENVVLTAANGDQVFAKYEGTLTLTNGVGKVVGVFSITGGTGRFVGATGYGSVEGVEALNLQAGTGQGEVQLKGVILY